MIWSSRPRDPIGPTGSFLAKTVLYSGEEAASGGIDFNRFEYEEKPDMVNRPPHYNQGNIEVSDFIIDQKMGFLEGNVIKYVSSYRFKNGLEDLKKAQWYLNKLISTLEENK